MPSLDDWVARLTVAPGPVAIDILGWVHTLPKLLAGADVVSGETTDGRKYIALDVTIGTGVRAIRHPLLVVRRPDGWMVAQDGRQPARVAALLLLLGDAVDSRLFSYLMAGGELTSPHRRLWMRRAAAVGDVTPWP